jgi:hypothetical protein
MLFPARDIAGGAIGYFSFADHDILSHVYLLSVEQSAQRLRYWRGESSVSADLADDSPRPRARDVRKRSCLELPHAKHFFSPLRVVPQFVQTVS